MRRSCCTRLPTQRRLRPGAERSITCGATTVTQLSMITLVIVSWDTVVGAVLECHARGVCQALIRRPRPGRPRLPFGHPFSVSRAVPHRRPERRSLPFAERPFARPGTGRTIASVPGNHVSGITSPRRRFLPPSTDSRGFPCLYVRYRTDTSGASSIWLRRRQQTGKSPARAYKRRAPCE